jgi:hypothetical protein
VIKTSCWVNKILRHGYDLILGVGEYLEVFDIKTSTITHTHKFSEALSISDMIVIDETYYLLATLEGLMRTTKDRLIKHYYKGEGVESLSQMTDSMYLVGFRDIGLIVWNE